MTLSQQTEWAATKHMLNELWPRWAPTDEQRRVWQDRCGNMNQESLRDAIREVWSSKAPRREPQMPWIMSAYYAKQETRSVGRKRSQYWIDERKIDEDQRDMRDDLAELDQSELRRMFDAHALANENEGTRLRPRFAHAREQDWHDGDVERWSNGQVGWIWAAWRAGA